MPLPHCCSPIIGGVCAVVAVAALAAILVVRSRSKGGEVPPPPSVGRTQGISFANPHYTGPTDTAGASDGGSYETVSPEGQIAYEDVPEAPVAYEDVRASHRPWAVWSGG